MEHALWLLGGLAAGIVAGLIIGAIVAHRAGAKAAAGPDELERALEPEEALFAANLAPDGIIAELAEDEREQYYQHRIADLEKEYRERLQELEEDLVDLNRSLFGYVADGLPEQVMITEEPKPAPPARSPSRKAKDEAHKLAMMAAAAESRLLGAAEDDELVLSPSAEIAVLTQKIKRFQEEADADPHSEAVKDSHPPSLSRETLDNQRSQLVSSEMQEMPGPHLEPPGEPQSWMAVIDEEMEDEISETLDQLVDPFFSSSASSKSEANTQAEDVSATADLPGDLDVPIPKNSPQANQPRLNKKKTLPNETRVRGTMPDAGLSGQNLPSGGAASRVMPEGVSGAASETHDAGRDCWLEKNEMWEARFYENRHLKGDPVFTRQDAVIDFEWTAKAPEFIEHADGFSASWQRSAQIESGDYRFTIQSVDGVRFFIGGRLVISAWYDHDELTLSRLLHLPAGLVDVKLEHYNSGRPARIKLICERES